MTRKLREYYYDTKEGRPIYVQLYDDEVERFNRSDSVNNLRRINDE